MPFINTGQYSFRFCQRLTAIFLILCLTPFNSISHAATVSAQTVDTGTFKPLNLSEMSIPEDLGKIEVSFAGSSGKTVVLIQDAHEIPDAQKNIQRLIDYFEKNYGVNLVALEGANAPLDPRIFKSFPDKEILKKVFKGYQERGELAAGAGAAIFGRESGDYEGVEDWPLYEEGVGLYLQAMKKEPEAIEKIKVWEEKLAEEKEKAYSPELLALEKTIESFYLNHGTMLETLKQLAAVKPPAEGSELALILKESQAQASEKTLELEVKKVAEKIKVYLESTVGAPLRGRPDSNNDRLREFNDKYQDFRTSRMPAKAFALFLKKLTARDRLPFKISKLLSSSMKDQRRMEEIKGTKFFEDFEHYADEVRDSIIRNEEERKLGKESRDLRLVERLAKLELSREDWNEIKSNVGAALRGRPDSGQVRALGSHAGLPLQLFSFHFAFYENSEKRDAAFMKNLDILMRKKQASSAVLVAGGFHAEGLTHRLQDQGISYVRLMPAIQSIPEDTHYRDHMKGDVSWKKYLKPENGRINLYNAFVRGARDRLLNVGAVREPPLLLKSWRDQIIIDLANQNKVEQAGRYTRLIDEAAGIAPDPREKIRGEWMANIERFAEGLRALQSRGELTRDNLLNLLKPAAITTPSGSSQSLALTGAPMASFEDLAGAGRSAAMPRILPPVEEVPQEKSPQKTEQQKTKAINQKVVDKAALESRSEMRSSGVETVDNTKIMEAAMRFARPAEKVFDEVSQSNAKVVAFGDMHRAETLPDYRKLITEFIQISTKPDGRKPFTHFAIEMHPELKPAIDYLLKKWTLPPHKNLKLEEFLKTNPDVISELKGMIPVSVRGPGDLEANRNKPISQIGTLFNMDNTYFRLGNYFEMVKEAYEHGLSIEPVDFKSKAGFFKRIGRDYHTAMRVKTILDQDPSYRIILHLGEAHVSKVRPEPIYVEVLNFFFTLFMGEVQNLFPVVGVYLSKWLGKDLYYAFGYESDHSSAFGGFRRDYLHSALGWVALGALPFIVDRLSHAQNAIGLLSYSSDSSGPTLNQMFDATIYVPSGPPSAFPRSEMRNAKVVPKTPATGAETLSELSAKTHTPGPSKVIPKMPAAPATGKSPASKTAKPVAAIRLDFPEGKKRFSENTLIKAGLSPIEKRVSRIIKALNEETKRIEALKDDDKELQEWKKLTDQVLKGEHKKIRLERLMNEFVKYFNLEVDPEGRRMARVYLALFNHQLIELRGKADLVKDKSDLGKRMREQIKATVKLENSLFIVKKNKDGKEERKPKVNKIDKSELIDAAVKAKQAFVEAVDAYAAKKGWWTFFGDFFSLGWSHIYYIQNAKNDVNENYADITSEGWEESKTMEKTIDNLWLVRRINYHVNTGLMGKLEALYAAIRRVSYAEEASNPSAAGGWLEDDEMASETGVEQKKDGTVVKPPAELPQVKARAKAEQEEQLPNKALKEPQRSNSSEGILGWARKQNLLEDIIKLAADGKTAIQIAVTLKEARPDLDIDRGKIRKIHDALGIPPVGGRGGLIGGVLDTQEEAGAKFNEWKERYEKAVQNGNSPEDAAGLSEARSENRQGGSEAEVPEKVMTGFASTLAPPAARAELRLAPVDPGELVDQVVEIKLSAAGIEKFIQKLEEQPGLLLGTTQSSTQGLVSLAKVQDRTAYWIGLLSQLQDKKINISVRLPKQEDKLGAESIGEALVKAQEQIDRVILTNQDGSAGHELPGILKKNHMLITILKNLAKFNDTTLTEQAVLPVLSKETAEDTFADIKDNRVVLGVGISNKENIQDPLLEQGESILQVVAALLLANSITDPRQLQNAQEIKELNNKIAAQIFEGSSVGGNILQYKNGIVTIDRGQLQKFFADYQIAKVAGASA